MKIQNKQMRGQAAFSLAMDPSGKAVCMHAELLAAVQLGRSDRLLFDRKANLTARDGTYKGSLKVIFGANLIESYLQTLERTCAEVRVRGAGATIKSGKLDILFSCDPIDRERWTQAKTGNKYLVVNLWLGISNGSHSLGANVPSGESAFINAVLKFET